ATQVGGRTDGLGVGFITDASTLTGGTTFDECRAIIDTVNHITTYYFNGVLMGATPPNDANPLSQGVDAYSGNNPLMVGNTIGRIRLERQATATATGTVTIDDIQITACSGTCSATVTPTAGQVAYAVAGTPATPSSFAYTITNGNL